MSNDDAEWFARCMVAKIERIRAANELAREMLSRSYEQLAKSEALLRLGVPAVWHPEPPASCPSAPAIDPGAGEASGSAAPSPDV